MKLDFISRKKNTITVSDFIAGTVSGLEDIHTVKSTFSWAPPTPGATPQFATITLNVYEIEQVDTIELTISGSLNTILIERSIDGFNWEILSSAFTPTQTTLEIDYTNDDFRDFKFIKMTIDDPGGNYVEIGGTTSNVPFKLKDWKVFREVTYENTDLISHNVFNLYSPKEIDKFPIFPDFHKQVLRMLEGNNDLDLRLFDESIWQSSGNFATFTTGTVGDILTVTPSDIPVISDTLYIWDFDDAASGSTSVNNIIVTENPLIAQTHDYSLSGAATGDLFLPRLLIQTRTYMIEIVKSFIKV